MRVEPETAVELAAGEVVDGGRRVRGLVFLGAAVACVGFTLAIQMGTDSNFTAGEMGLSGSARGQLEAFRESCGVVALGVLAVLSGFAEPLVGAGMLVLVAVGLGAYAFVGSYAWLVAAAMVWSQGFHVWVPLPQSMALALAEPGRAGHRLGQIRAAAAAGSGAGLLAALGLSYADVAIRPMYLLAAGAALLGGAACLGIGRRIKTPGPRLVFRRRYGLYYLLCFLEGWRKQIFIAFAGFLLVKQYGVELRQMLWLWVFIQAIGYAASPWAGRLIDRVGERPVLVAYFGCLTLFFVGYAFIRSRAVLCALYVADSAFFVLATALTTYVNRIAPPAEHTPTLSMGVALNHVAAVTMPLAGGLLWRLFGYQWTFLAGALAAAVSVPVAMRIPPRGGRPAGGAGG